MMKNKVIQKSIITIFVTLTTILSCTKEETKPAPVAPVPTADFIYTGANLPAPATVTFTNTSTNATAFVWDFGNNSTSTDINPEHTFASGGVYTVKLTSTGAGGKTTTSKTINIGSAPTKVKITKVNITNIPFVDGTGSSWDFSTGPDVYFNITDISNNILSSNSGSRVNDVTTSSLPLSWTFTTPFEIADINTSRFIDVWDFDSPDSDDNIGYVGFAFSNYTTGSNPYPSKVSNTQNGITVELNLTWE